MKFFTKIWDFLQSVWSSFWGALFNAGMWVAAIWQLFYWLFMQHIDDRDERQLRKTVLWVAAGIVILMVVTLYSIIQEERERRFVDDVKESVIKPPRGEYYWKSYDVGCYQPFDDYLLKLFDAPEQIGVCPNVPK